MNFTKLAFNAALVGAILMNQAAHAQSTDASQKMKEMIDVWAGDMKQIITTGHGEKRRNDLKARTEKLNADVQGKPCTFNDRGFYENHTENAAKAMSATVKATFDCNRENKTEAVISFKDVAAGLYEDDTSYNLAVVSNASIRRWINDWASEEKKAIADTSDLGARAGKVTEIANAYKTKFQDTRCHKSIQLDFSDLAGTASRGLPITLETKATCDDYRLNVTTFRATLNIKPENDNAKFKPTFSPNDFTWDRASSDMFPTVEKLAKSADRTAYADKFRSHGTFDNLLNQIRCSDFNAVKSGFPNKMQSLQSAVSFRDLKVACANDGTHLTVSVHVEAKK